MTDIETRITDLEIESKKFELESQEKKIERLNKANSSFFNQLTLFFVAQSMLFLSLATTFNIDFYFFKIAICTLGLGISIIFFISFHYQLQFINHLKEKINPKDYPKDVNDILGKTIPSFLAVL